MFFVVLLIMVIDIIVFSCHNKGMSFVFGNKFRAGPCAEQEST
jgi:hypothetical protein